MSKLEQLLSEMKDEVSEARMSDEHATSIGRWVISVIKRAQRVDRVKGMVHKDALLGQVDSLESAVRGLRKAVNRLK